MQTSGAQPVVGSKSVHQGFRDRRRNHWSSGVLGTEPGAATKEWVGGECG